MQANKKTDFTIDLIYGGACPNQLQYDQSEAALLMNQQLKPDINQVQE